MADGRPTSSRVKSSSGNASYAQVGGVPETEFGSLTMLQLPDDPFVSLELVHDPAHPVPDGYRADRSRPPPRMRPPHRHHRRLDTAA